MDAVGPPFDSSPGLGPGLLLRIPPHGRARGASRGSKFSSGSVKKFRRITVAILAGLLAGCVGQESRRSNPAPALSLDDLKRQVGEIRALPFKQETQPSAQAPAVDEDEHGRQSLAQLGNAYKRIGLLEDSTDLATALTEFTRLKRFAYYEPKNGTLAVAREAARLGRALAGEQNAGADQTPAVLALTRALQNQYFRWSEKLQWAGSDDRRLALCALADGDSLLVALNYLVKNHHALNWGQAIHRFAAELERSGSRLPVYLQRELGFPYRDGSQFVQWAFLAKGWNGVNALFTDPPRSSAQILYPEKFFLRRENPLRITPFGLTRQMKQSAVVDQTLGAYRIQSLLGAGAAPAEAPQIAAAWAGDQLSAYPDGDGSVIAWISAWSGDQEARGFQRAFLALLERRHYLRFNRLSGQNAGWKAELRNGRSMVLQTRGPVVLLLDGIASARALEVGEELWNDLEIAPESADFSFESAKGPAQRSLRSR